MSDEYPADLLSRAARIQVLLMDVDGVMTDGCLYYAPGPDGEMVELKGFNSQDGVGLHLCRDAGLATGVISGRQSKGTDARAQMLGMRYVYQGKLDKLSAWDEILADARVDAGEVAYIGDDLPDIPLLRRAGLAVAVANARREVKELAHYITPSRGGEGAVREAVELILRARGLWDTVAARWETPSCSRI